MTIKLNEAIKALDTMDFYTLVDITFGDLLDAQAARYPNNDCLIARARDAHFTYAQFRDECNTIARGFMAMGIKKGDHVAIWATNYPQWITTMFAAAKIGAVLVTVNTNYKRFELEYLLKQSDSMTLVLIEKFKDSNYLQHLREICPELDECKPGQLKSAALPYLKNVIFLGEEKQPGMFNWSDLYTLAPKVPEEKRAAIQESLDPHDVINMQYTSGTTGFPKGVMLTHHNVINNGKSIGDRKKLTPIDRECIPVPLFHCFGCVLGVTSCITHASAIILVESFNPVKVLDTIEAEKCTSVLGVPTMFISMLTLPQFSQYNLTSLRTGIMAGSPCPIEIMKRVNTEMHVPEIVISFGMTESSPVTIMTSTDDPVEKRVTTIGTCQPNVELKIIDPETGKEVPPGTIGELLTRGYQVMKGYYKMPGATAQAIDAEGWLHTGDLCSIDEDGYYKVSGRLKDIIIRGGENIYPREIEEFLYCHPDISDVQVVSAPDEKYGEEVLAFIILNEGAHPTPEEIIEFAKKGISNYKVPRYVIFLDSFPMTDSGKIQKFKLREMGVEMLNLHNAAAIETA